MVGNARNARSSALPRAAERLGWWLGAAILIGGLNIVVGLTGAKPPLTEGPGLILGLCAVLAVTGLVAVRSSREASVVEHEERERPALDELLEVDDASGSGHDLGPMAYVTSMEQWAEAMLELSDHATATPAVVEAAVAAELTAACEATRDLRDLLRASADVPLTVNGIATLHSICSSWEADQARIEHLAARIDPDWHRSWRARWVVERLLRRGGRLPDAMALPYRG